MAFVPAICTQCGAQIEVDNTSEAAVCKFCGTPFVVEKAINNYNTYVTTHNNFAGATVNIVGGDIENCLSLSKSAFEGKNFKESLEYANKALEIDINNADAWCRKTFALAYLYSDTNDTSNETFNCGKKVIELVNSGNGNRELIESVYEAYMLLVINIAYYANKLMADFSSINKWKAEHPDTGTILKNLTLNQEDTPIRLSYAKYLDRAAAVIQTIPEEYMKKDRMQRLLQSYINNITAFYNSNNARLKEYGRNPTDEILNSQKRYVEKYKSMLTDSNKGSVTAEIKDTRGCYVATCVYGSYDCPEVWTLRRYRDYTLDKTWYGRLFIKLYYAISPIAVRRFGHTKWFKSFWKAPLDRMVCNLKSRGISDTEYQDKY